MNPLVAALVALVVNVVAALVAMRSSAAEGRSAVLAGSVVTLGAAALCAFPLLLAGEATALRWGVLALRADVLAGTMLLPLGLVLGAFALAAPQQGASPRRMAGALFVVAAAIGALLADNLALLLLAEGLGGAALAWILAEPHRHTRPGQLALGAAGVLALAAGALALAQGTALEPLSTTATGAGGGGGGGAMGVAVAVLLLLAVMLRLGVPPFSTGLTAALQGTPSPAAVWLAVPLGGVVLLVRVVQPILSHSPLGEPLEVAALALATLAALTGVSARDLGRAGAWTLAALNSLVLAGNIEPTEGGTIGGELLWAATIPSAMGFALALLMVTRRLGVVDLRRLHGLQPAAPALALLFLLLALSVGGLPGTLAFVAEDLLLSGEHHGGIGGLLLTVVAIAAIGFNTLRMYFQVFFGPPQVEADADAEGAGGSLDLGRWERLALAALVGAVLAGGLAPGLMPLVASVAVGG